MKTLHKITKRIYARIATYAITKLYKHRITPVILPSEDGMIYHITKMPVPVPSSNSYSRRAWISQGKMHKAKKDGQYDNDIVTLAED